MSQPNLSTTITIQPNITIGQITTVAEKVLEALFKNYESVLESENPMNDKKQFYTMRGNTIKMLTGPIKAVRELKKPIKLKFQFDENTGIMKMSSFAADEP